MTLVVYIISGLFILMMLALLFAYSRTRHSGLLLISMTYGASAGLALMLLHWWPLAAGFVLAWALRLLGFDPDPNAESGKD
jgi:hypothetical protein